MIIERVDHSDESPCFAQIQFIEYRNIPDHNCVEYLRQYNVVHCASRYLT